MSYGSYGPQPSQYSDRTSLIPDASIVKIADWNYHNSITPWQQYWFEADIDRKMVLGDQKYINQYVPGYEYQKFVFNHLLPMRNMIVGRQRSHRKASNIIPVENSDSKTASQLTTCIDYAYSKENVYNTISNGFSESIDTGLCLLHPYLDYSRGDPISGDLKVDLLVSNQIMMDPWWTKLDLSDCNFIYTRKYLRKEQIIDKLGGHEDEIDSLSGSVGYDLKFTFMPEQYQNYRRNLLAYDEYWYLTERKQRLLIDTDTYEIMDLDEEDDEEELRIFLKRYPEAKVITTKIPTVNLAIMVQGREMYNGRNPLGIDRYPFIPIVAYHNNGSINYQYRYFGPIRQGRDSQYLYNHRRQLELDMLEAQFNGEHFEEGSLVDNNDAFMKGPGKKRFFKKGRLGAYMESPGSRIDPSNFQATENLKKEFTETTGITEELLGQSQEDVGIVQMLKQGAGLITLHSLFDNLDMSQRLLTITCMEIIQKNWQYGKVRRILGEEPTEQFRYKSFQKFDCQVEDAPITSTSRQLVVAQLIQLIEMGFNIPKEYVLKYMSLQDKDKLLEYMAQQNEAQAKQQQQAMMLQMENQKIINNNLKAKADSDEALAQKRIKQMDSQILVDMSKIAESQAERSRASLDEIKAAKELATIDIDQLAKLVDIIKALKQDDAEETTRMAISQGASL